MPFGRFCMTPSRLEETEVSVRGTAQGVDVDGLLDFDNCLLDIAQPGQRVTQKDLGFDMFRVQSEDGFSPRFRFIKALCVKKVSSGSELLVTVTG